MRKGENHDTVIAFESKYLELLDKKKVKFKYSYNRNNLTYLDDFWFSLIDAYKDTDVYLDVAQLIKHAIGLINYKKQVSKNVVLVYIYWKPDNYDKFIEYSKHQSELVEFSARLKNQDDLEYVSMTYSEFWANYNDSVIFKSHFDNMKIRYKIEI